MIEFTPPEPEEVATIRAQTTLSADDFGRLIGYKDPDRTIRALENGMRHGRPYRLSGTATAALTYARALAAILKASDGGRGLQKALADAAALIPLKMRK